MDPEGLLEAVIGVFVMIILIYVFSQVILAIGGVGWTILFVGAAVALTIAFILNQL